jgi:Putative adhesin
MSIRIALLSAATLAVLAQAASAEQNFNKRSPVAADATVDVSNVQGSVEVTAWDRNEVQLTALLESDKDRLEYEATDKLVRVKVHRPDHRYHDDDDATLTLNVPKGVRLIVDTISADIAVNGVRGEQRLETVSGEVETMSYDQPVSLHSVSGDISLKGSGGKARVTTESVSGSTTLNGIRGGYDGQTVSGTISANVSVAERLHVEAVSGDVEIQADLTPTARVELESVSGTLSLVMKPPVHAEFEIESFSGDIDSCFGTKAHDKSKYGPGSELNFTQGNGGARVMIESLSGDISICDR